MEGTYWLMFSQYSLDKNMYPFHIGEWQRELTGNLTDLAHNNRKQNKWQTVYVGTFNECLKAQRHLSEILKIMHGVGYNQFLDDGSVTVKLHIDDYAKQQ